MPPIFLSAFVRAWRLSGVAPDKIIATGFIDNDPTKPVSLTQRSEV
jgi:hypothetical protein